MPIQKIKLDIFSDVVCPWCYIGKRHLDSALKQIEESTDLNVDIQLCWRAFQLNPQLSPEGMSRSSYTASKFGGTENATAVYSRVEQAAQQVGINLNLDKILIQPNSSRIHELIMGSREFGLQGRAIERFFEAFFLDGKNLSDEETLIELAAQIGMPEGPTRKILETNKYTEIVAKEQASAHEMGIQGVPYFIFNEQVGLSGAQPADMIVKAVEHVTKESNLPS